MTQTRLAWPQRWLMRSNKPQSVELPAVSPLMTSSLSRMPSGVTISATRAGGSPEAVEFGLSPQLLRYPASTPLAKPLPRPVLGLAEDV